MNHSRGLTLATVGLLTLLGFALRVYRLDQIALRGDEAFTVIHWMREPLAHTLDVIATVDPHPPLAYAIYRAWGLVIGAGETTARFLPALLATLGIPAIYALGRRLGNWKVGVLAAFLWAIHPYAIWHAQDARNYALWSSFSLIAVWLAVRGLQRDRRRDWFIYVAAAAVAAYFYYLELFTLAALSVYAATVYWGQWRRLRHWGAAMAVVGVLLAPWYLQPRALVGSGYGGTTGGFDVNRLWLDCLPTLTFGQRTLPASLLQLVWIPLAAVLVLAAGLMWRQYWRLVTLTLAVAVLPAMLLGLVSLKLNVFEPRYILATAPVYALLTSAFSVWLWQQRRLAAAARAAAILIFCGWLVLDGLSLNNYFWVSDYAKSKDWRALVAYLHANVADDDIIVQAAADEAFNFYADEYGLTMDRKQLPAGTRQSVDEIVGLLAADEPTHRSMWRVAQTFSDWPNAGVVERWLADHMQQVLNTSISGLPVRQYMPWEPRPDELSPAPLATFDAAAQLRGARVLDLDQTPGELTIWLYLQAQAQTKTPLKIFVQLIGTPNPGSGSPLWTQDDQFPQDGRVSTTTWTSDAIYRDVYELPLANVPPGEYSLITGLYDPATGVRVLVAGSDYYTLDTLQFGN